MRTSPEQRAVLVLDYHVGLSVAEVADVLGTPVGTASARLHYAAGRSGRGPALEELVGTLR